MGLAGDFWWEECKMGIPVKLEVFEGPLDLLLHLVDKNKVNIYDIPIVIITEQYLAYVNEMERQDLDVVSEFLVMAATLIDIKSRMLLPCEENEEGEKRDPRQELVERLLEYKKFKYISGELRERQQEAEQYCFKEETMPLEVLEYEEPLDLEVLLADVTLVRLHSVFQEVMRRQEEKIDPVRSKFGRIEKDRIRLQDRMEVVRRFVIRCGTEGGGLRALLERRTGKMDVIVTFLAVLELVKVSVIRVEQERFGEEILLYAL